MYGAQCAKQLSYDVGFGVIKGYLDIKRRVLK